MDGLTKNVKRLRKRKSGNTEVSYKDVLPEQKETNTVKQEEKKKKRIHKKKKKKYYEKQHEWMQEYDVRKKSRKSYKQVNRMRHGFQSRSSSCRNKEGEILTNNTDVVNR
jgi:hypothetical protein